MFCTQSPLRSIWIIDQGGALLSGSFQSMPDVVEQAACTVSAFLRSSELANVRPGKKSSTRWSTLLSAPSFSAMATRLPITDLVAELIRCLQPR